MGAVETWVIWIVRQLFSEGVYNYMLEETLRGRAGHHIDANFDIALQKLMDDGIVELHETEGQRHYGIPLIIEKLKRAKEIANSTPIINAPAKPEVIQEYLPDPEGFEYWFSPPDNPNRTKKKSIYDFYRGIDDKQSYLAIIRSQSDGEPKTYRVGSMKDADSYVARGWTIFNELVSVNPDGAVSLMELIKRDTDVFGSNKRRGKILLAIYEREGWIVKAGKRGNDIRYRLANSTPPQPKRTIASLEEFMKEPDRGTETFDFNETFNEDEDVGDSQLSPQGKSDKPSSDNKG